MRIIATNTALRIIDDEIQGCHERQSMYTAARRHTAALEEANSIKRLSEVRRTLIVASEDALRLLSGPSAMLCGAEGLKVQEAEVVTEDLGEGSLRPYVSMRMRSRGE